ncbi:MAG: M28 family metallopeptidase [Pseudomonadota bacterium]
MVQRSTLGIVPGLFAIATLLGCTGEATTDATAVGSTSVEAGEPIAKDNPPKERISIDEPRLRRRIETLASDDFLGRAPATEGGAKTRAFLVEEMKALGLEPPVQNDDGSMGYEQSVPLVETTVLPGRSELLIDGQSYAYGTETVFWTKRAQENVSFDSSEVVFVGYGIVAPEYDWNDYEGLDVKGKTVLILVNDPGFATQDPEVFNGNAMTYYGRWTYKFEEAARQGAAAALIIHQTEPAAYGWGVVQGSWAGPQIDLLRPDNGDGRVALEGWLHEDKATELFAQAGYDFANVTTSAATQGFEPIALGVSASGSLTNTIRRSASANVAGLMKGSEASDEYVLYVAHWDHLGSSAIGRDSIANGAVDNATGTAGILSIAEAIAAMPEAPRRSIIFLAVTAEEAGLLGSAYFAEKPFVDLGKVVGGINIDGVLPLPPTKNLVVTGYGASELEGILEKAADARGMYISPDPQPEKGYFYRSDHISIAKKGVPMLYADLGPDLVEGGTDAAVSIEADYRTRRYHKPADEYEPEWDTRGIVTLLEVAQEVGLEIANSDAWPNWYEGNEFRAIRDAQRTGL